MLIKDNLSFDTMTLKRNDWKASPIISLHVLILDIDFEYQSLAMIANDSTQIGRNARMYEMKGEKQSARPPIVCPYAWKWMIEISGRHN